MKSEFIDKNGTKLTIIKNRSNIQLVANELNSDELYFYYNSDFIKELIESFTKVWKNFKPKEADSLGSDYDEYYDRKLDCNGYLNFGNNSSLYFRAPNYSASNRLYQFNKRKAESFVYDLLKKEDSI